MYKNLHRKCLSVDDMIRSEFVLRSPVELDLTEYVGTQKTSSSHHHVTTVDVRSNWENNYYQIVQSKILFIATNANAREWSKRYCVMNVRPIVCVFI